MMYPEPMQLTGGPLVHPVLGRECPCSCSAVKPAFGTARGGILPGTYRLSARRAQPHYPPVSCFLLSSLGFLPHRSFPRFCTHAMMPLNNLFPNRIVGLSRLGMR